ncbi:hypothetical protein C4559_02350 [Candidatus Microgenomates bacterium]|nr:MAG: hypothetical protein C4559_02350 [Candidatus Microgenomates bacterium]
MPEENNIPEGETAKEDGKQNPIAHFFSEHTHAHYPKKQDDLIDIHIGNPLRKIMQLLEDIKNQKAFSFTLKGSLGVMGVALALSLFGIFGSSKMLCDKGIQTQVGIVKELYSITQEESIPIFDGIANYYNSLLLFTSNTKTQNKRVILLKADNSTIFLPYLNNITYIPYLNRQIFATGQYDSCSQTLTPSSPLDLQLFQ